MPAILSRRHAVAGLLGLIGLPAFAQDAAIRHVQGEAMLPGIPARPAVYDLGLLDILQRLAVAVSGVPGVAMPASLQDYADARFARIGTLFEPDLPALAAVKPDVILIAERSARQYAALSAIAPTLDLTVRQDSFLTDMDRNIAILGRIFGRRAAAEALSAAVMTAIADMTAVAAQRGTGLVLFTYGADIVPNLPGSRFGFLHAVTGLRPVLAGPAPAAATPDEQRAVLARALAADPDWLLVLDRGTATGGAPVAAALLGAHEAVRGTKAWRRQQLFYLDAPGWYLAGGGPTVLLDTLGRLGKAMTRG